MRITRARRTAALGAAGAVALSAFLGMGAGSALALNVPNATTSAEALPGAQYGDITDTANGLGLVCVPGKAEYLISYRGSLDMVPVVNAWNRLKETGRTAAAPYLAAAAVLGYTYDGLFNELKVSGDFKFTFTVDKDVVDVDNAKLVDFDMWDAAYKAANAGTDFPNQMIVDRSKTPTYDAATGTVTVFFKLADGLTAGQLDNTYNAQGLKQLNIDSLKGLLKVSKAHFKAVDDSTKNFLLTEPTVTGTFYKPVSPNALVASQIDRVMAPHFPITFGQPAAAPVKLVTTSTYALTPSYVSEDGTALPSEIMSTLPAAVTGQAAAVAAPATPTLNDSIKASNGDVWTFKGWTLEAPMWNDDAAMGSDCYQAKAIGTWSVKKAEPTPEPTLEVTTPETPMPPKGEPGKPAPKKNNPKLAHTGADTLLVGGAAAAMLLAGAGVVAARRRDA